LSKFKKFLKIVVVQIFIFSFFSVALNAQSIRNEKLFPLPKVLEPNVEFWKNIYAKYSEREVVVHDSWQMDLIYEVVNLDSLFQGASVSSRIEWKKIDQIKKKYSSILLGLARHGKIDVSKLRGEEKRIALLFPPDATSKDLRAAAKRIRGQSGLRERFRLGLLRSGKYMAEMKRIFNDADLPLELLALPHVESSFNHEAYSKLGAAGLWQFTRSTGRSYMKVDYNIDQRLDPLVATESAAKLLAENYRALGVWPLAITAYNHGRNGMKRAKRKFGDDLGKIAFYYRSRSFGFASRNFYSEFLAALHVSSNYQDYFGEIKFYRPTPYIEFDLPDYITVNTLIKKVDVSLEVFKNFNPALRSPVLKSQRRIPKFFSIRVPYRKGLDLKKLYAEISPDSKYQGQVAASWHTVRRGENLSQIARRYRVSMAKLMTANNIRNAHRINVGQNLQIPGRTGAIRTSVSSSPAPPTEPVLADAKPAVKNSPSSLLDAPGVTRSAISSDSIGTTMTSLSPGKIFSGDKRSRAGKLTYQKALAVPPGDVSVEEVMAMALPGFHVQMDRSMNVRVVRDPKVEDIHESFRDINMPLNGYIVVEPDETLGHFADWLDIPTYMLRKINYIAYGDPIHLGKRLLLSFKNVTPEGFHDRRIEYHQGIEEDFYRNFQVQGESSYTVRRGDNLWVICNRRFELPHWLLKKYNPEADLTTLRAGQTVAIPTVQAKLP